MDLTIDEDILASDGPTHSDLSREFTRPNFSFKGNALRPITAGSNQLFSQVLDRNDANTTAILSFIFIHCESKWKSSVKTGKWEPTSGLLDLCWDKNRFRAALLEWVDTLGEIDHKETGDLFEAMNKSSKKGVVDPLPEPDQKKTKAKRRAK
jgi:hypothetical protein